MGNTHASSVTKPQALFDWTRVRSARTAVMASQTGLNGTESSKVAFSIPDPTSLPCAAFARINEDVLRKDAARALRYGGVQGHVGLREWLAADAQRKGDCTVGPENFALTCGAAGALENLCETLLNPGDTVFVENPTFPGSLRTMRGCLARVVGLPMDADGVVAEALQAEVARAMQLGSRPKLFYTIANFNNPSGITTSLKRRRSIIEVCRSAGVLIAQDDAYGPLSFRSDAVPSIYHLTGGNGAVLIGTFSKTVATGLRIGWIMGAKTVIDDICRMRFDLGVSPWTSSIIAEFCRRGLLDEHVERVTKLYRPKRDAMIAALAKHCIGLVRWSTPQGGFSIWIELEGNVNPGRLFHNAWEAGVGYIRGSDFFADGQGDRFVRLCYSTIAVAEIREAIATFSQTVAGALNQ